MKMEHVNKNQNDDDYMRNKRFYFFMMRNPGDYAEMRNKHWVKGEKK